MASVYVARHGETDFNRAGRYQGQRESQLTQLGLRQADALAGALAPCGPGRVICSPLSRCVDTGAAIAKRWGVAVETDERLLEIAHGTWEGRLRAEIERDDAARMRDWRERPDSVSFPGGETLAAVDARWRAFAAELDVSGTVAVVTHDVLVRLAILWARGRPAAELWRPHVCNGGYARFDAAMRPWELVEECCSAHLAGLRSDETAQAL